MSYQSPLYLFDSFIDFSKPILLDDIVRLRKKILAEFNFSGQIQIKIKGKLYTKDDIINQIDTLKSLDNLDTHIHIYKDKTLLYFCENPTQQLDLAFTLKYIFSKNYNSNEWEIINNACKEALQHVFKQLDFKNLNLIVDSLLYLKDHNKSDIIHIFNTEFEKLLKKIKNLNKFKSLDFNKNSTPPILNIISNNYFYQFLNKLPEELADWIDEIAVILINFTVDHYKKHPNIIIKISKKMIGMKTSNDNLALIINNHSVFADNISPFTTNNFIITIIIVGTAIIASLVNNGQDDKSENYKFQKKLIENIKEESFNGNINIYYKKIEDLIRQKTNYRGAFFIGFNIEINGTISNPVVNSNFETQDIKNEIIEIIKSIPKWNPRIYNGDTIITIMQVQLNI